MINDFHQITWNDRLREDWAAILRLAMAEDFGAAGDLTSNALVPEDAIGRAAVVARRPGVVAGLPAVEMTLQAVDRGLHWSPQCEDGRPVAARQCVGTIEGPARGLLAAERIVLNVLGRLSGIATLTRRYVDAVAGAPARIYDTRKTTPGWRRLEKYAVRCGGGRNHRGGLDEAVLIKDNHLALGAQTAAGFTPAEAVQIARQFIDRNVSRRGVIVEIEVDTLEQFDALLRTKGVGSLCAAKGSAPCVPDAPFLPDIVLLDNMTPDELREAVTRRNAADAGFELEASGGVDLTTVRAIAESGVERISVGALTHSVVTLDFGLDWQ
ncbi:MAG: nicotinate-nucleotide diphosphorylase [Thermoguttaceae bacterium]